ncbi:iron chelate uptake ABC transporter family permease subunit [Streptomyces anulatus]
MSRNALASPDVIGFSNGAATGAILVIVTFGGAAASVAAGPIGGGLVTALLVSVLASSGAAPVPREESPRALISSHQNRC